MDWDEAIGMAFLALMLTIVVGTVIAILVLATVAHPGFGCSLAAFGVLWAGLAVCFKKGWIK